MHAVQPRPKNKNYGKLIVYKMPFDLKLYGWQKLTLGTNKDNKSKELSKHKLMKHSPKWGECKSANNCFMHENITCKTNLILIIGQYWLW